MIQNIKDELELFISEAERLTGKAFYTNFQDIGITTSNIEPLDDVPSEDEIEACVLHLRKFFQKNDRVCIHNLNNFFLENLLPQDELLKEWSQLHSDFEEMLSAGSVIGRVKIPDSEYPEVITLMQLFKAKTYGDLSHLDKAKRKKHLSLSSTESLTALYKFEYITILLDCGEIISEMATTM